MVEAGCEVKVLATGFDGYVDDDRPAVYITPGFGNLGHRDEVHLEFVDAADDIAVGAWFPIAALEAALKAAKGE